MFYKIEVLFFKDDPLLRSTYNPTIEKVKQDFWL